MFRKNKLNVLVLGSQGMLGHDLYETLLADSRRADSKFGIVTGLDKDDFKKMGIDLTRPHALCMFFADSIKYDWVVNCVAMTDTRRAESCAEGRAESYRLNALVPKFIAESCAFNKTSMIHISTDYVFSGNANNFTNIDFTQDDSPFPVNIYGTHKLLGEEFIKEEFAKVDRKDFAILRTSWLYGDYRKKSFVHRFVANAVKCAMAGEEISVTKNEWSVPTNVDDLILAIRETMTTKRYGTFNAVCRYDSYVSRADFAEEILTHYVGMNEYCDMPNPLNEANVVPKENTNLLQTGNSTLQPQFICMRHWKDALHYFMSQYGNQILADAVEQAKQKSNS